MAARDTVAAALALQRTVGNRATTQVLARKKPKTPVEAGSEAVTKRRWGAAVAHLSWIDQADEQTVLQGLDKDELRTLHFRTGSAFPGKDKRLMQDIRAEFQSRGIS